MWTKDLFNYERRNSRRVSIGRLTLGGDAPVRIQSMANTNTNDTGACVEQARRIVDAGGELVRFTAQGTREANNLKNIREALSSAGERYAETPLVADIHFMPAAADVAAEYVEKVRINPGNYVDKARTFAQLEYTDEEYAAELQKIRERFVPFLNICKQHHRAIRIGVNHGSLSDRIMSRYGDTPEGMVESCMEFLRICVEELFDDVVISIKASNTVIMVDTVRLLAEAMEREGMDFPLHLGVTEAGDGEDGRIKSAVGIGALLADGIGDTIRVSLSEDPEREIPVAAALRDYIVKRSGHAPITGSIHEAALQRGFKRRTQAVGKVGGGHVPAVFGKEGAYGDLQPDYILREGVWIERLSGETLPVVALDCQDIMTKDLPDTATVVLLSSHHANPVGDMRAAIHHLMRANLPWPVVAHINSAAADTESLQLQAAADMGVLLMEGLLDGLYIAHATLPERVCVETAFGILQATRQRISKTEYISCPGCGRTMFDLQTTIARIKSETSHLKGLKIGIMGCIVNGPGEMADADYGYVGAGKGKVSLYKQKECIEKNIPTEEAVNKLISLIKKHGDWHE